MPTSAADTFPASVVTDVYHHEASQAGAKLCGTGLAYGSLYESIPDFQAELLRHAVVGEQEWGEWIWRGTKEDGTPLEERGVTIMGIRDGQIAWGRLYLEETEREGGDITETVGRMAGREEL